MCFSFNVPISIMLKRFKARDPKPLGVFHCTCNITHQINLTFTLDLITCRRRQRLHHFDIHPTLTSSPAYHRIYNMGEELMRSDDLSDDYEEDEPSYAMYKDRQEWADVVPLSQDDGPEPVVQIDYSPRFKDVYDFLRAVMKAKEYTPRALALTSDAIMLNAANYTVWQYRRDILLAMGISEMPLTSDLVVNEFKFSFQMIEENQKNYQVWHHRKSLVSLMTKINECGEPQDTNNDLAEQDMFLTKSSLSKDSKNYHAWQHRQWVIKTFKIFDGEMEFVTSLILEDVRNNSAWNHRYFILLNNLSNVTKDILDADVEFTWTQIDIAISNESPWSYFNGLLNLYKLLGHEIFEKAERALYATVTSRMMLENGMRNCSMLSFFLDLVTERLTSGSSHSDEMLSLALKSCDSLIENDLLRTTYWKNRRRTLKPSSSASTIIS